jgi:hypothetical protein
MCLPRSELTACRVAEAQQFFHIREVKEIQGGHAVTFDVYSDRNFNNLRYEGLRRITITGSPVDSQLEVNTADFWLGIFSIRASCYTP